METRWDPVVFAAVNHDGEIVGLVQTALASMYTETPTGQELHTVCAVIFVAGATRER